MDAERIDRLKQDFGCQMTEAEEAYLRHLQAALVAVQSGKLPFREWIVRVWEDFKALSKFRFDMQNAPSQGFHSKISHLTENLDSPIGQMNGTSDVSVEESRFLDDVNGLIEFTIRNGLGFLLILEVLIHDLKEIIRYDMSLTKARSDAFLPKASGWGKLNEDSMSIVAEPVE